MNTHDGRILLPSFRTFYSKLPFRAMAVMWECGVTCGEPIQPCQRRGEEHGDLQVHTNDGGVQAICTCSHVGSSSLEASNRCIAPHPRIAQRDNPIN